MTASTLLRTLCAAAVACCVLGHELRAQQQPSAAAVALAREVLELKGALIAFDPVLNGAIEYHRNMYLQANPTVGKDLGEVSAQLRGELAPRRAELHAEVARAYASQFTEQELKDAVAFYKTPLGKKLIDAEPKALEEANKRVEAFAVQYGNDISAKMRAEMRKRGHTQF
jgi:hypothetical protein